MILLDTNVVSEFAKLAPDPAVERWYLANAENCWLSSITVGEIAFGVARLARGAKRSKLEAQLADWRVGYASRTHVFASSTAMIYGEIMAEAQRQGRAMAVFDAQIAAIAVEHGFDLATRNKKNFATTGLTLLDPWAA